MITPIDHIKRTNHTVHLSLLIFGNNNQLTHNGTEPQGAVKYVAKGLHLCERRKISVCLMREYMFSTYQSVQESSHRSKSTWTLEPILQGMGQYSPCSQHGVEISCCLMIASSLGQVEVRVAVEMAKEVWWLLVGTEDWLLCFVSSGMNFNHSRKGKIFQVLKGTDFDFLGSETHVV